MRERLANLLTLPYRLWMLALDKNMLCTECHSIVSGGFGGFKDGEHTFMCMDCADEEYTRQVNLNKLKGAWHYDPDEDENKRRV